MLTTNTTAKEIARAARTILDRPVRRTRHHDWAAVEAVQMAAAECGLVYRLQSWVPQQTRLSLTAMAQAYVTRYVEAYGLGVVGE